MEQGKGMVRAIGALWGLIGKLSGTCCPCGTLNVIVDRAERLTEIYHVNILPLREPVAIVMSGNQSWIQ
jgi:hypothetical protein